MARIVAQARKRQQPYQDHNSVPITLKRRPEDP